MQDGSKGLGVRGSGIGRDRERDSERDQRSNRTNSARGTDQRSNRRETAGRTNSAEDGERRRRRPQRNRTDDLARPSINDSATESAENLEHSFRRDNRFREFDPSLHHGTDSRLNELMRRSHGNPSFLDQRRSNRDFGAFGIESTDDGDDVWGVGDESDETMQRLLEQSYAANKRTTHSESADEDSMLQAAIQASLMSSTPNPERNDSDAVRRQPERRTSGRGIGDQKINNFDPGEEEDLRRALILSQPVFDEETINAQIGSMFDSYPEEVVFETQALFADMRNDYETSGGKGPVPSLENALDEILKLRQQREKDEEKKVAIQAEWMELEEKGVPEEVISSAKAIFDEMVKAQQESGGAAPSVDFTVSLARDRLREKQKREEMEAERQRVEQAKQEEEVQRNLIHQRNTESRAERAARMAAAMEKRMQSEEAQQKD